MDLQIEYRPENVRVILRGPRDSQEMCRILALLQSNGDKLWAADGQGGITAILPQDIVWAETVDDKLFVYTATAIYQADCSLASLELRWGQLGLFRCAKSALVNLQAVQSLHSCPGGRIQAVLQTGEKVMISRRYAPALREKLQEGAPE